METRARIIATIGPASQEETVIRDLMVAGVDVFRLNFSHGSHEGHAKVFHLIRRLSQDMALPVAIIQDLQGPKIRTGELEGGQIELKYGQELILTSESLIGNRHVVSVSYPRISSSLSPGSRILLDDGNLELRVTAVKPDHVTTQVVLPGILKPYKGVNFPGMALDVEGFTEKDQTDLAFGLELGVDALAISFVRTADDVRRIRQAVASNPASRANTPIIAKLERPEGLANLDSIIQLSDGVMVARGDLGVELEPQVVPIAQKRIIEAANRQCKIVITATQMLDSMIQKPRPTRAEASDVANAILDGSDGVMLSGETATGQHPVTVVQMMDSIIRQAEEQSSRWGHWKGEIYPGAVDDDTLYMAYSAQTLAHDRTVAAIAVFTMSGKTARVISKLRPVVPILAFTPEESTFYRLKLFWGVSPYLVPQVRTIEEMLVEVESCLFENSPLKPGQQVVLVCGYPILQSGPTNLTLLHTIRQK